MNIGILTQPLRDNYGGILQAYALQTYLSRQENNVFILDRMIKKPIFYRLYFAIVRRFFLKSIGKGSFTFINPIKENQYITKNTTQFINTHIKRLNINRNIDKTFLLKYQFNVFIVGSDQVWRPKYSLFLPNYFLDFTLGSTDIKRIAFAASFGVDSWEFTEAETKLCKPLAQAFDAISVREDSAIKLCKEHFDIDVALVIDPTLLLSKEDYIHLIESDKILDSGENLMNYILDSNPEIEAFIQKIANDKMLIPFMSLNQTINVQKPSVTNWLRGFMDAEFVITDSFHGCIFSILFNKEFIVYGNKDRGLARFNSLLKLFGLEDRLIPFFDEFEYRKINHKINWDNVNAILEEKRFEAKAFLNRHLV